MKEWVKELKRMIGSIYWIVEVTTPAFIIVIIGLIVNEKWYLIFTSIIALALFIYGLKYRQDDEEKEIRKIAGRKQ